MFWQASILAAWSCYSMLLWSLQRYFRLYIYTHEQRLKSAPTPITEGNLVTAAPRPNYSDLQCWWNGCATWRLVIWPIILNEAPTERGITWSWMQKEHKIPFASISLASAFSGWTNQLMCPALEKDTLLPYNLLSAVMPPFKKGEQIKRNGKIKPSRLVTTQLSK